MFLIPFSLGIVLLYVTLYLLELKLCRRDPAEPPFVSARIPFIGHLVGLTRYGVSYYRQLREKTKLPILTLTVASQRIYVVNSPALISQIHRRQKAIDASPPFIAIVFGKLFAFEKHDMDIISQSALTHGSLRFDTRTVEHGLLERGTQSLEDTFNGIASAFASRLGEIACDGPEVVKLGSWLRMSLPLSTGEAVFGPNNPFAVNDSLLQRFWEFENGLKALTMGVLPSLLARGPAGAREELVKTFQNYVDSHYDTPSPMHCQLVGELVSVARRHGRDNAYLGRYLFATFSAFIINTVPITFWAIAHIIADRRLLADIQSELDAVLATDSGSHSDKLQREARNWYADIAVIREKCPTLLSAIDEVLRTKSSSTGTMIVHEDTLIDNTYLLKKGAIVQMAATAIHSDPRIWGSDAAEFYPRRSLDGRSKQVHPSANRTFGGGGTLCPGRHLAVDEIVAFTAMILFSFDAELAAEINEMPQRDDRNMLSVMKPTDDIEVRLSRRSANTKTQ